MTSFGLKFTNTLIERTLVGAPFTEILAADGQARLTSTNVNDAEIPAGVLRLWIATGETQFDRMIHFRLQSDPVDTQLFFLFGRPESVMPHFHAQVVQFSADACVFNAEWLPRLDPVEHPDYYAEVFSPMNKPYWKAVNDRSNVCSLAAANPAIAVFLSPWSIGVGRPTDQAELDRVGPNILEFHDHCLKLSQDIAYPAPDSANMRDRDKKHLDIFFDDALDPRAWKGVYHVIGEHAGQHVKEIFKTSLR